MKIRGQTVYPPEERIDRLSMPEPNSGCWIWLGACRENPSGMLYGRLVEGSRSLGTRKTVTAHRYSYEAYRGPIYDGLYVCHKCDNPTCVNPDHLFLGTQSENMIDAYRKGRITLPQKFPSPPSPSQAKPMPEVET